MQVAGNVIATGYFGRDANDYIAWSNNPHTVAVVVVQKDYVLTLVVLTLLVALLLIVILQHTLTKDLRVTLN